MIISPSGKQIGTLPSQHPADWKKITGPRSTTSSAIASSAAVVAATRGVVPDLTEVVTV